jgi:hypothetical protein
MSLMRTLLFFYFFCFLFNFHSLEEVFQNDLHHLSRTHTRLALALSVLTVLTVGQPLRLTVVPP